MKFFILILLSLNTSICLAKSISFTSCSQSQKDTVIEMIGRTFPMVEDGLNQKHNDWNTFSNKQINTLLNKIEKNTTRIKCSRRSLKAPFVKWSVPNGYLDIPVVGSNPKSFLSGQPEILLYPDFFDKGKVVSLINPIYVSSAKAMCRQGSYFWRAVFYAELNYNPPVPLDSPNYVHPDDAAWTAARNIELLCSRKYTPEETY